MMMVMMMVTKMTTQCCWHIPAGGNSDQLAITFLVCCQILTSTMMMTTLVMMMITTLIMMMITVVLMVMPMVMRSTRTVVMRSHEIEMRKTMRDGMAGGLQTYQVRRGEEELHNTCKDENRVTYSGEEEPPGVPSLALSSDIEVKRKANGGGRVYMEKPGHF